MIKSGGIVHTGKQKEITWASFIYATKRENAIKARTAERCVIIPTTRSMLRTEHVRYLLLAQGLKSADMGMRRRRKLNGRNNNKETKPI